MRRAHQSRAFSVPVQERCVKAKHMIASIYYLADRGIFDHSNRVRDAGDLSKLSALNRWARLDDYFIIRPARAEALYELCIG